MVCRPHGRRPIKVRDTEVAPPELLALEMDSEHKRARDAVALQPLLPQRTTSMHGDSDACMSSGFTETRSEG